jgi:hypothetical protein
LIYQFNGSRLMTTGLAVGYFQIHHVYCLVI